MLSKDQIEGIRRSVDLVEVASGYVELRRAGKDMRGRCPFHTDDTPSFNIQIEKQTFKCFGCGVGGDVFKFLMLIENIKFPQAIQRVQSGAWKTAATERKTEARVDKTFQRFSEPVELELKRWMDGAHAAFLRSSRAHEELKIRGITLETGKRALLGWIESGKGIVGPDGEYRDYYDHPWIGIPYIGNGKIRLLKWRVAFSAGKKFARKSGMVECLYTDNLPPDPLEDIFVFEGEVDTWTAWQLPGVRACGLPSGTQSRLTKEDLKYLLGFRLIYLCLDNDESGRVGLRKILLELPADRTRIVVFPEGVKDINDLLVKKYKRDFIEFSQEFRKVSAAADKPSSLFFIDLNRGFEEYIKKLTTESKEKWFDWPWRSVSRMADIGPGQVVSLISSRSGMGKTSFAVQATMHNALHLSRKIGYYSAEMDTVSDLIPIITAQITQEDRNRLEVVDVERAKKRCESAEFYVGYDPDAGNWQEHADLLEMAIRRLGVEIIVIDHLDYIIREADWAKGNAQKSLATRWFKKTARKYGVLFIVLKQSVKQDQKGRKRGDQPADIYDTSGPATTVDDADHAFVIHRPKRQNPNEEDGQDIYENKTILTLGKTRHKGPGSAVVSLVWNGPIASFEKPKGDEVQPEEPKTENLPYKDN